MLLEDSDLSDATINRTFGGTIYATRGLTCEEHEFLDAVRDDGRWKSAKRQLEEAGTTATLAVLKRVLEALAWKALEARAGGRADIRHYSVRCGRCRCYSLR